jgi:hypothetical protein
MALVLSGDSPSISGTYQGGVVTSGTAVASTSGTSIDFTSIPSWVKRVTINFSGVSGNGSSIHLIQIGTSGGIQNTGYTSTTQAASTAVTQTAGFGLQTSNGSSSAYAGIIVLTLLDSSTGVWVQSGIVSASSAAFYSSGVKTLSGTLDRVRITTVNGTDTFDAGSINILYE